MIAFHPESGASPDEVRWVVPVGLRRQGRVVDAPGLGTLLRDHSVAAVTAGPGDAQIRMTAGPGRNWADLADRVRAALAEALADQDAWVTELPEPADSADIDTTGVDAAVLDAARVVLAGEFGAYVASHGGRVDIHGVDHGCLHVTMEGACRGCPAAQLSLRVGFEHAVRRLCPTATVA